MSSINFEAMFQINPNSDGSFTGTSRRSRRVKYWKMCERPNCNVHRDRKGWVTIGPTIADANDYAYFTSVKHMTELPNEYGVELDGAGFMTTPKNEGITRFLPILQNNGLHEFPADQIVALGWHKIPEVYNSLTDKQRMDVDAITATVFECEFGCMEGNRPRTFYRKDLLARHIKVHHRESVQAVAVGNAVKQAIPAAAISPADIAQAVAAALSILEQQREQQHRRGRQPAANEVD